MNTTYNYSVLCVKSVHNDGKSAFAFVLIFHVDTTGHNIHEAEVVENGDLCKL